MQRALIALSALFLVASGCSQDEPITVDVPTPPSVTQRDVDGALLRASDLGEGWEVVEEAEHSTVQIGGRFGPANITEPVAESVSAFVETDGPGAVSNSVFVLQRDDVARSVVAIHETSAVTTSWTQDRVDEGTSSFELAGAIDELSDLGDERFTATLDVEISTEDGGDPISREIQYVVYRVGPVVGFVIAQDASVIPHTRRQAARVARLGP